MSNTSTKITLLAATTVALGGCQGVVWANFVALGVTVTLFFTTLQLGRRPGATSSTSSNASTRSATRSVS